MKTAFITLGCPKNEIDTEIMQGLLQRAGFALTQNPETAHILVINTCSFIEEAREEAIRTILEAIALKKEGSIRFIVVCGCLPQSHGPYLKEELKEVDAFLGTGDLDAIVDAVTAISQGAAFTEIGGGIFDYNRSWPRFFGAEKRRTAYLRIAEGCNRWCSYCIIPSIRGPYRSRPVEGILQEAEMLVAAGIREIICIAQDTGAYGQDLEPPETLSHLLQRLCQIPNLHWIRILYLSLTGITVALLATIKEEKKVLPYLDIPIQHSSPRILQRMNRRDGAQQIEEQIQWIRETLPSAVLRTTLMVGFPGEGEDDFQNLYDFVKRVRFHRLGVFTYSREEKTEAAGLPHQIPQKIKESRQEKIYQLQKGISREINNTFVGEELEVLVEEVDTVDPPFLVGRSQGDAPEIDQVVSFTSHTTRTARFTRVKILRAREYELLGEEIL